MRMIEFGSSIVVTTVGPRSQFESERGPHTLIARSSGIVLVRTLTTLAS